MMEQDRKLRDEAAMRFMAEMVGAHIVSKNWRDIVERDDLQQLAENAFRLAEQYMRARHARAER